MLSNSNVSEDSCAALSACMCVLYLGNVSKQQWILFVCVASDANSAIWVLLTLAATVTAPKGFVLKPFLVPEAPSEHVSNWLLAARLTMRSPVPARKLLWLIFALIMQAPWTSSYLMHADQIKDMRR